MKTKWEGDEVEVSARFLAAVVELMEAECEMMGTAKGFEMTDWTWGRCRLGDLSTNKSLEFTFGGDEDLPDDGLGRFAVLPGDK